MPSEPEQPYAEIPRTVADVRDNVHLVTHFLMQHAAGGKRTPVWVSYRFPNRKNASAVLGPANGGWVPEPSFLKVASFVTHADSRTQFGCPSVELVLSAKEEGFNKDAGEVDSRAVPRPDSTVTKLYRRHSSLAFQSGWANY